MTSRNRPFVSFLIVAWWGSVACFIALMALPRTAAAFVGAPLCCQLPGSGCFMPTTLTCPSGTPVPGAICESGSCVPLCGNGSCDIPLGENPSNCPSDCGPPSPVCGNNIVEAGEDCDPPGAECSLGPDGPLGLTCSPDCGCFLPVEIDIRLGDDPNPINLKSKGVIPVAILTTDTFDATMVDAATVCFGDAEDPVLGDCTEAHGTGHIEDVDGDGDQDLMLHFNTPETGIDSGDTQACLTGMTDSGVEIQGCDGIFVVGDLPPGGPTRIDCGGYVAFTNIHTFPVSVSVSLTDHCAEFDSEITCRRNVNDPESQYDAAIVPDGHSGSHVCEDLPPLVGGVFVVCNGLSGGCSIHIFPVSPGPGPG